jgi:hypothetical protein
MPAGPSMRLGTDSPDADPRKGTRRRSLAWGSSLVEIDVSPDGA